MAENNIEAFRKHVRSYEKQTGRRGFGLFRRRGRDTGLRVPWSALLFILAIALCLKAFVLLSIGEKSYERRLTAYDGDGYAERIGVFIMRPDPVTRSLHDLARPVIGR